MTPSGRGQPAKAPEGGRSRSVKRGNGEGSVYWDALRRKYTATVSLGGGKRKYIREDTEVQARKALRKALQARDDGRLAVGPRQTVGQFLTNWLDHSARPTLRANTYARYENVIRCSIAPHIGRVPLTGLTPQHVQVLQNRLLAAGQAPRSVLKVRLVLGSALDQAEKWSYIARNPVPLVDPPRVPADEREAISPDQAYALLDAVQGDRLEALYTVALALGLRRGEALGLRWQDVDLETRVLHVRRALQRVKAGGLRFLELKTRKSRRDIALPHAVLAALQAHKERQAFERRATEPLWQEHDLVFTSTIGTPLEPRNVNRHFTAVLKRAGLPHLRFHDLRHGCATLLLLQGVELKVVQEILGHASVSTTGNIYAHVLDSLKRGGADQMDAILARRHAPL